MKCLKLRCHLEDCAECGKITPFIDMYCLYCHCNSPFGDFCDFDIPDEEIEAYLHEECVYIGDLREASKDINEIINKYYPI